jgi:hypothetical protein
MDTKNRFLMLSIYVKALQFRSGFKSGFLTQEPSDLVFVLILQIVTNFKPFSKLNTSLLTAESIFLIAIHVNLFQVFHRNLNETSKNLLQVNYKLNTYNYENNVLNQLARNLLQPSENLHRPPNFCNATNFFLSSSQSFQDTAGQERYRTITTAYYRG